MHVWFVYWYSMISACFCFYWNYVEKVNISYVTAIWAPCTVGYRPPRSSGLRPQVPQPQGQQHATPATEIKINTFPQSGCIILASDMICFVGVPLWLLHGPSMILCTVIRSSHNVTIVAGSRAGPSFHNHPSLLSAEAGWYVFLRRAIFSVQSTQ